MDSSEELQKLQDTTECLDSAKAVDGTMSIGIKMMTKNWLVALAIAPVALAQSISGLWDATIKVNDIEIPFRFELSNSGTNAKGTFFNGDDKFTSTSGRLENGALSLAWDYYLSKLDATFKDGVLEGRYTRGTSVYPFSAKRFTPADAASDVPSIAGLWVIPTKSPKGESAWQFIVRQSGPEVSAAILRVDGDTGALTGTYRDGKFVLGHFSGVRPSRLDVTLAKDGTLDILQNGKNKLAATRSTQARAQGLPEPTDPSRHTSVKDPTEPFRSAFPIWTEKWSATPIRDSAARSFS